MSKSDDNRRNVSVQLPTYWRLTKYGTINDSFSGVIEAIVDYAESKGMTKDSLLAFREEKEGEEMNKAQKKMKKVLDKDVEADVTISIVYYYGKEELSREVKTPIRLCKDDTITMTFDGMRIV